MPLKPGSSRETVSSNIREFHTGKTYAHTAAKFGKAKANKQAIAVALSTARKYKSSGGAAKFAAGGLIRSHIPGRTDKIPMNVASGSYIIPADIPSAVGQGNTDAGAQVLGKMFKIGPYGSGATGQIRAGKPITPRFNWMHYPRTPSMSMHMPKLPMGQMRAQGGDTEQNENDGDVPIIAAGGEMVIPPEQVTEIGHGNIDHGHKVLDKFVLKVRQKHIETLKKLKPPKK